MKLGCCIKCWCCSESRLRTSLWKYSFCCWMDSFCCCMAIKLSSKRAMRGSSIIPGLRNKIPKRVVMSSPNVRIEKCPSLRLNITRCQNDPSGPDNGIWFAYETGDGWCEGDGTPGQAGVSQMPLSLIGQCLFRSTYPKKDNSCGA